MKNKLMQSMILSQGYVRRGAIAIVSLAAVAMMTGCGADAASLFDLILNGAQ